MSHLYKPPNANYAYSPNLSWGTWKGAVFNGSISNSEKDIKFTADMTRQLFEDEPSNKHLTTDEFERRMQTYLSTGCEAFHFLDGSKTLGYALVNKSRKPYYLIDFIICREFRRNGYGRIAFYSLLNELHTETIDLDVFCWNTRGRKFWESLGFKELAIIMRKE